MRRVRHARQWKACRCLTTAHARTWRWPLGTPACQSVERTPLFRALTPRRDSGSCNEFRRGRHENPRNDSKGNKKEIRRHLFRWLWIEPVPRDVADESTDGDRKAAQRAPCKRFSEPRAGRRVRRHELLWLARRPLGGRVDVLQGGRELSAYILQPRRRVLVIEDSPH